MIYDLNQSIWLRLQVREIKNFPRYVVLEENSCLIGK